MKKRNKATLGAHPIIMYQLPVNYEGDILSVLEAKATDSKKKIQGPVMIPNDKRKFIARRKFIEINNKLYYGL